MITRDYMKTFHLMFAIKVVVKKRKANKGTRQREIEEDSVGNGG